MINIDGIQVDITTSIDSLSNELAVFIVEFEFDNRLIVCHTFNQSVYRAMSIGRKFFGFKSFSQIAIKSKFAKAIIQAFSQKGCKQEKQEKQSIVS